MKANGDFAIASHDGNVRGARGGFGNAGKSTGVTDTYGADLEGSAINRMGSMAGACKSDPAFENCGSMQSCKE